MFREKGTKKVISVVLSGVLAASMIAPGLAFANLAKKGEKSEEQIENVKLLDDSLDEGGNQEAPKVDDVKEANEYAHEIDRIRDEFQGANNKHTEIQREYQEIKKVIVDKKCLYEAIANDPKCLDPETAERLDNLAAELNRLELQLGEKGRELSSAEAALKQSSDKYAKVELNATLVDQINKGNYKNLRGIDAKDILDGKVKDFYQLREAIKKVNPKLTDDQVDAVIKDAVVKMPKTYLQKIKDSVFKALDLKTIFSRAVSTFAFKYLKGAIINGIKDWTGINIVGKTYSYAEMANLVNSIDSSVDTIKENIKVAHDEFSEMVAEQSYRDFVRCITDLKSECALIKKAQESAIVWGIFRAGEDCEDADLINKYTNEGFASFLGGRFDYIDDMIMNYMEFKNRLTSSFSNNGKTVIDLVDECADKHNDVFKETYEKKENFRNSIIDLTIGVNALMEAIALTNSDFADKYDDASRRVADSMVEIQNCLENKDILTKYGFKADQSGQATPKVLEAPYFVSKKAYVGTVDYLSRDIKAWAGLTGKIKGSTRLLCLNPENNIVIAPFPHMIDSIANRPYKEGQKLQVGVYMEDFKNSDAPAYKKWNDRYLGKDDVSKLWANKPAGVSFKDYLTKTLKFDLGDSSKARYLVVDCLMDYTSNWFCRDDFEMRLSYFDIETGKYYQNQVVARGDIGAERSIRVLPANDWRQMDPLSGNALDGKWGSYIKFKGILAENDGIFAVPIKK